MRAHTIPNDDHCCGWYHLLPPADSAAGLRGVQRADWVVLGAGFTGLAAARQLAQHTPGSRVILLDAQRVGFGASGRNSGFIVDVGHYEEGLGREGNRRLVRLARAGIDELRAVVQTHGIECAWSEQGRLHGAVEQAGMRALERFCRGLEEMGEPFQSLDAPALEAITGTRYYRAGARTPGTVLVQPAALARGLGATLPANVELFEESPVRAIRRRDQGWQLECAAGAVDVPRLLLATNGFTPSLGFLRRRVFPMMTFASLTRPLLEHERRALGGEPEWGLVPEERMGTSVRRTRDQRILIRNTVRYVPSLGIGDDARRQIRDIHRRSFRARFPMLAQVEFEYSWGGVMGMSLNNAQFFGRIEPGLFASVAYNGVGIAMGTVSGMLLADLAVGSRSDLLETMQALPGPSWVPPDPLLRIAARATLARLQRRAGAEL